METVWWKTYPRDWDCNSKGCPLDQKQDNIGVEGKHTCLYTNAKSKCSVVLCEKHKSWHRSRGEWVKCPDLRVSDGPPFLLLNSGSWDPSANLNSEIAWLLLRHLVISWCRLQSLQWTVKGLEKEKNMKSSIVKSAILKTTNILRVHLSVEKVDFFQGNIYI